jgi:heme-degrading monooxygenase HmoA
VIAVIFEAVPQPGRKDAYLDLAAHLRPMLDAVDGFVSIERFESLATPGKILSLSLWRDEAAVRHWRDVEQHRAAQRAGREVIFSEYRVRVMQVLRDYSHQQQA